MTTVHNQIHLTLKQINIKRSAIHIEKGIKFAVNDWVLVDRRNQQVKAGNNRSLTNKWIGPYKVIETIGTQAYRLEVPKAPGGITSVIQLSSNHSEHETTPKTWMKIRIMRYTRSRLS